MSLTASIPLKVQMTAQALRTGPGSCDPALRRAVEAYAAHHSGAADQPAPELPADLIAYVDKVTRHADQITDNDVRALQAAGYSEDAIFEITLCASLGAGLARLERGLLALEGG
jgi:alkylhydroperoxidase family enzyme